MNLRHLIPVLLVLVGCIEPELVPRNLTELVVEGDRILNSTTMKPYSGPVFSLHEGTENVHVRTELLDGRMNGPYEMYHKNGQFFLKGSYSNGVEDGPFEWYYRDGQLWSKGSYANGEYDGPIEFYYENGQLQMKGSYVNGVKDGPRVWYRENGQLKVKRSFSNGERCGEWIEYGSPMTYPPCPSG